MTPESRFPRWRCETDTHTSLLAAQDRTTGRRRRRLVPVPTFLPPASAHPLRSLPGRAPRPVAQDSCPGIWRILSLSPFTVQQQPAATTRLLFARSTWMAVVEGGGVMKSHPNSRSREVSAPSNGSWLQGTQGKKVSRGWGSLGPAISLPCPGRGCPGQGTRRRDLRGWDENLSGPEPQIREGRIQKTFPCLRTVHRSNSQEQQEEGALGGIENLPHELIPLASQQRARIQLKSRAQ